MHNQYLPIGSICTLANNNKKVMIIGYNPPTYNGSIKTANYLGCTYPEGFLLPNMMTTFMESEISKVDFMGYKDDTYTQFVKSLSQENVPVAIPKREKEETVIPVKKETGSAYQFDENGVVIVDPFASNLTPQATRPADYKFDAVADANYAFDEDGMVIADNTVSNKTSTQLPKASPYKFDENGVIIEDNSIIPEAEANAITNNQYKFDENGVVIEDNSSNNQNPKPNAGAMYEFDADGVIVADHSANQSNSQTIPEIKTEDIVPKYRFDENGVIIDDLTVDAPKESKLPFVFDENGVILADNTVVA